MAAITSFSTLQTEVLALLHRPELTSEVLGFIQLGEFRVYRELRVRQMETALSAAISSGTLAVPAGYLEMKYAYINGSPMAKLQRKDAEWIYQNYPTRSADSQPKFFAREAETFIFGPYPDSAYTVKGVYYKKLDALSVSNTSNWLITDVPDLILYATACEAAQWTGNLAKLPMWEEKYAQIKRRIQVNDEQEEFSGSPLQVTVR